MVSAAAVRRNLRRAARQASEWPEPDVGNAASMRLTTIKRSAEFHRVRGGARWATPSFVIETKPRPPDVPQSGALLPERAAGAEPHFGFTITRKLGSAVVRNRIRRRFKAIVRGLDPSLALPAHDYVVVARTGVAEQPFAELKGAIETALRKLQRPRANASTSAGRDQPHATHTDRQPGTPRPRR